MFCALLEGRAVLGQPADKFALLHDGPFNVIKIDCNRKSFGRLFDDPHVLGFGEEKAFKVWPRYMLRRRGGERVD